MKLSVWAKSKGLHYRTAWNMYHAGQLPNSEQLLTGTIIVSEEQVVKEENKKNVIYCRISSTGRKHELQYQVNRCEQFCSAKGVIVHKVFKEVASGMNDSRREFLKMIEYNPDTIIVENKDRLTRFGFNYLKVLLKKQGCNIIVIHEDKENESDLVKDMISVVTSFCCRLYGLRRGRAKSTKIKEIIHE